jgi:hypothetical protein
MGFAARDLVILALLGLLDLASTGIAVLLLFNWLYRSRWGPSAAIIVTCLAVIPLVSGAWLIFDVLWMAWWLIKRTWLYAARYRNRLAA